MSISEFFFGKPEQMQQLSRFAPGQEQIFQQMQQHQLGGGISQDPLFGSVMGFLQSIFGGQDEGASALEAPAMRQFREQIIPGIAERFSGLGAGAQSSSAFQQALGGAGAGLAENLAAMRSQRQMDALSPALSFSQVPHQQQMDVLGVSSFENMFRQRQPGILENLLGQLAGGVGPSLMGIAGLQGKLGGR